MIRRKQCEGTGQIGQKWVIGKGKDPPVFCPLDGDNVVLGLALITNIIPEIVVDEFWFEVDTSRRKKVIKVK